MRKIKFRAWEFSGKFMIDNFHEKDSFQSVLCGYNPYSYDYTIMQWTGLTDKNGKEVYEGDIIETWAAEDFPDSYIRTVVVDDSTKQLTLHPAGGYILCEPACSSHFEVIGNIHESPELLEATK